MKVHEVKQEHPVITELKEKLESCRSTLLDLLNEWHFLKEKATQSIMFTYETLFGDLEYELRKRGKTASELEKRVELLSFKLRKGEKLSEKIIDYINMIVSNDTYNNRKSNNSEIFSQKMDFQHNKSIKSVIEEQYELPALYRQLVKKMHPDLNGNNMYFEKFWNNVQDAYKSNDVERLRMFYDSICKTRENTFKDLKSEEISLRTEIKQLELNIAHQKERIKNLQNEEPFNIKDKLNDKYWIERRKKSLKQRLNFYNNKIDYNKNLLKHLTSGKVVFGHDFNLVPKTTQLETRI
jgi:hypothetical protein